MLSDYSDIRKRIKEDPKWWDTHGVPRYDDFHPDLCPNIYANEVILYKILCQDCKTPFLVESHRSDTDVHIRDRDWLKAEIESLHYGDPPIHGCVGDTMNCYDIKVVEYWGKNDDDPQDWDWHRNSEFEIDLPDAREPELEDYL